MDQYEYIQFMQEKYKKNIVNIATHLFSHS